MKAQLLALLIAKFMGVSEQILSRIADRLAKTATTEDQVTTAVEGVTLQSVIDSYADGRATDATNTAISNYEKKHGLTNGQKATGGEPITEPIIQKLDDDTTPPWAKALIDSNKALNDKFAALEGEKVTTSRKQKFEALIANLPDEHKKAYQRTSIDTMKDEEFDTLISDVGAEVGVIEATIKAKGSVFSRPFGGGGDIKTVSQEVKDRVEARSNESTPSVIRGLQEGQ